jgi:FkbM family methyltransferase
MRLALRRDKIREVYTPPEDEYFSVGSSDNTFQLRADEAFCDAGAYRGTVIQKFLAATRGQFDVIHAFEPDRKTFPHLCKIATLPFNNIHLHDKAVGERTGNAHFWQTGTMGSHVLLNEKASENKVPITRIDDVMDRVTFIKMDLEGFEARALRGASGLIAKCRPRMAITAYHYADDLLDICATIRELMPNCSLRLRHHHLSFYDTVVYAHAETRVA